MLGTVTPFEKKRDHARDRRRLRLHQLIHDVASLTLVIPSLGIKLPHRAGQIRVVFGILAALLPYWPRRAIASVGLVPGAFNPRGRAGLFVPALSRRTPGIEHPGSPGITKPPITGAGPA